MKKKLLVFLAAFLLLGLGGCMRDGGGAQGVYQEAGAFYELSADDLVKEALRRFDALEGWSFSVATSLDCEFMGNGPNAVYQASGALIKADLTTHGSVSYRPDSAEHPTELYTRMTEDGGEELLEYAMHIYRRTQEDGAWEWTFGRTRMHGDAAEGEQLPSPSAGFGFVQRLSVQRGADLLYFADNVGRALSAGRDFRRMENGSVNGRRAVRFEGTVSGEALVQLLGCTQLAGCFYMLEADDAPIREGMPISLWIDAETVLPLRIELDAAELMQRELREPALQMRLLHLSDPEKLEEQAKYWDSVAGYRQGSQRIDLTPELPVIGIPAEIDAGMRAAKTSE